MKMPHTEVLIYITFIHNFLGFEPKTYTAPYTYTGTLSIYTYRCTALYGVPTMFIDMLNHPGFSQFDLTSLYTGVMAGSPCPIETMRQVIARMHMDQVTVSTCWDQLV